MIALICCLLALSSSAFGRSTYGGYSSVPLTQSSSVSVMRDVPIQQPQQSFLGQISSQSQIPVQTGYGQRPQQPTSLQSSLPSSIPQQDTQIQQPISSGYGSSYGAQQIQRRPQIFSDVAPRVVVSPQQQLLEQQQQLQQKIQETLVVTEADTLCRGQVAETVIPLDNGRRFVVCLDDSKGFEQHCPRGLVYHQESRRCERKLGPLENPCSSQPCLNGGQCVQTEVSSYQCQCSTGFDGKNCELDASVCQTQQPCGQGPDTRCQSFRVGAALKYICILQNGQGYGLNAQQVQPNPCQGVDGPRPLAITDKGFIMCDGEFMFVESCPGGTIWDDLNRACVWPDMQGVVTSSLGAQQDQQGYGQQSYRDQRPITSQSTYGSPVQQQRPLLDQSRLTQSFSQTPVQSYGSQVPQVSLPQQRPQQFQLPQQTQQFQLPQQTQQFQLPQQSQQFQLPQQTQQFQIPQQQDQIPQQDQTQQDSIPQQTSFRSQQIQIPQQQTSFGSQLQIPQQKPNMFQQPIQRLQQDIRPIQQQLSGY